jgi:hypothetical protein
VTPKVVFRPQADQEVQSARQWYDEQRTGLGTDFAQAMEQTVNRLLKPFRPKLSLAPISEHRRAGTLRGVMICR